MATTSKRGGDAKPGGEATGKQATPLLPFRPGHGDLLTKVATIVTPDTILRWHRLLIAAKHTYPHRSRVGRPGLMNAIREIILRMAKDNSGWGYLRIQGKLKKLDHRVARTTIAKTLKDAGLPPSPDRPTSWRTFLRSHAKTIAATDFFTAEVWTPRGLVTHYVLFVIHHATHMVEIAGVTTNPNPDLSPRRTGSPVP